jgi:hypothetical protein
MIIFTIFSDLGNVEITYMPVRNALAPFLKCMT